jgi:triacylglycerol lipase
MPETDAFLFSLLQANIGVGSTSVMARAVAAEAAADREKRRTGKLPPYSLKSPLLSRPVAAAAAEASKVASESTSSSGSSLLGIPSMFGSSITSYLLGLLDSPAYSNLTTHYLNDTFNPSTPDDPSVKYTSVAGRINKLSVLHPLWFPKLVLDAAAQTGYAEEEGQSGKAYEGNDGLVSVSSARWGEWLGTVDGCHHWDLRGEGGLFPNGPSISDKPEGRPDPSSPGGWDWKSDLSETGVAERAAKKAADAGASSAEAGMASFETLKQGAAAVTEAARELSERSGEVIKSSAPAHWDVAQVKQVVDWVADLIPTTGSSEASTADGKVGARQMEDAVKEKQREEARANKASEVFRHIDGLHQTGQTGKRERSSEETKGDKQKFDLGRFYGGLMVKLREDGF